MKEQIMRRIFGSKRREREGGENDFTSCLHQILLGSGEAFVI
jgi:hypothetical protein